RASARHDGVDRYLFDRKLPKHAKLVRAHVPHDFVRLATRVGEHFCHPFLRWQNDRQLVRPIVLQEKTMQVLFAVAVDQSWRRASPTFWDRPSCRHSTSPRASSSPTAYARQTNPVPGEEKDPSRRNAGRPDRSSCHRDFPAAVPSASALSSEDSPPDSAPKF